MLPEFFKFHILNKTGATIQFSTDGANNTFTIKGIGWKLDSNGAITYGSQETIFADPSSDLSANADLEGGEYDNSSNKYMGMHFIAELLTDAATSGRVEIYYEYSTDGSAAGTYPSDAADFDENTIAADLIYVTSVATDSTDDDRSVNFEL